MLLKILVIHTEKLKPLYSIMNCFRIDQLNLLNNHHQTGSLIECWLQTNEHKIPIIAKKKVGE